jgi:signal transduction histidine kinase
LKFTPAGGTVTVRLLQVDANLVLEVADTGIGISADKLGRVFDRFYQVDGSTTRRYSGVGLGLALVKEIAESHGGQVMVESQPGKGSLFRVTLPVMKDDALMG